MHTKSTLRVRYNRVIEDMVNKIDVGQMYIKSNNSRCMQREILDIVRVSALLKAIRNKEQCTMVLFERIVVVNH